MLRTWKQRRRALRGRLREEHGMTLIELMIGMSGGVLIVAAAVAMMVTTNSLQTRTTFRIEAANRGRTGMERITREIRAQQCFDVSRGIVAMRWAGDTGMEFYASIEQQADGVQPIQIRRLEWIANNDPDFQDAGPATGDIQETVWATDSDGNKVGGPSTRGLVLTQIQRPAATSTQPNPPIFSYYAARPGSTTAPSSTPLPLGTFTSATLNPAGRPSVAAASLGQITLVDIEFDARPKKAKVAKSGIVPFFNRVSVRSPLCQ